MKTIFILYGTAGLLFVAGALLINDGVKKDSYKTKMKFVHYIPIKNHGKGFKIYLGVVLMILGLLLFLKTI